MQTLSLNGTWKLTYRDQKLPGNIWGRWINAVSYTHIETDRNVCFVFFSLLSLLIFL